MTSRPPSALGPVEWTKAVDLLRGAAIAYLALVDGGGPYVVPINFAYLPGDAATPDAAARDDVSPDATPVPGRLVFHTGPGRKTAALASDPRVCVAVSGGESFIPAATPCKDGFAFRSVLVEGRATLLTDPAERDRALRAIVAKHDPAGAAKPFNEAVLARTLVYAAEMETVGYRELP